MKKGSKIAVTRVILFNKIKIDKRHKSPNFSLVLKFFIKITIKKNSKKCAGASFPNSLYLFILNEINTKMKK